MYYNVLELKDLVETNEARLDKNVLLERGDSSLSAIALKKHEVLENHVSACNACALVYDGEAEFHFNAEKFTLKNLLPYGFRFDNNEENILNARVVSSEQVGSITTTLNSLTNILNWLPNMVLSLSMEHCLSVCSLITNIVLTSSLSLTSVMRNSKLSRSMNVSLKVS